MYKPYNEPLWKNFIVNSELGTWAIIVSYEEDFSKFYIQQFQTHQEDRCVLIPDWKWPIDQIDDSIQGFFVEASFEDPFSCPFIVENSWKYVQLSYESEQEMPISIFGPYCNNWDFISVEEFSRDYPEWFGTYTEV